MRESVELFIRSVHLIAAIIWFGGVIFSTFITMPILRRNFVTARPVSSSQPFSDLDTIDDSCPPDNGRDGVLYHCME